MGGRWVSALLGPYSHTVHRARWWVLGGGSLGYERNTPVLERMLQLTWGVPWGGRWVEIARQDTTSTSWLQVLLNYS